jgi:hypothetical protein
MNLRIGITVDLRTSLFSNGINQNGLYLAMMYQDLGCDVTLLSASVQDNGYNQLKEIGFDEIQIKKIQESFEDTYDLIIGLGLLVEESFLKSWKRQSPNLKYVAYKCGNEIFTDMETIFHGSHEQRAEIFNKLPFPAIPDQIWSIPQMENTNLDYYSFTLHQNNATVVPFIWDPIVVENYTKTNGFSEWNGFKAKAIGVMEPNLSIMKNVLPPIMILDRYLTSGYDYSAAYLFSTRKYGSNPRLLKLLKESKSGLVNKVTAEDRLPTGLVLHKYIDLVLSWQLENNLNYLYFDVAWLGYPIVHNANLCQDIGYYYPNQDAQKAADQIDNAFTNHNHNYKQEQRDRIKRFTRQNPRLLAQYRKLTEDLMDNKFHKYIYNWKENEIYY